MSDIALLADFGLSSLEARIYLWLAKNQPQTILELASNLEVARTSIYDNIQKLLEKGLVERVILQKSQKIKAMSLESLYLLLAKRRTELEIAEKSLIELKKNISFTPDPSIATEVRYYKGAVGLQQMLWNSLNANKEIVGYSVFGRAEVVGEKFMSQWVLEFKRRGLRDRVIANTAKEVVDYIKKVVIPKPHQLKVSDIRFLDKKELYIAGDIMIYNNIYAVCYWKEGEVVGFEIDNPEFVKSQLSIFEKLWKMGKGLNNNLLS